MKKSHKNDDDGFKAAISQMDNTIYIEKQITIKHNKYENIIVQIKKAAYNDHDDDEIFDKSGIY